MPLNCLLRFLGTFSMVEFLRPAASMLAPAARSVDAAPRASERERAAAASLPSALKILHILRAPLGGLFRHVLDIAHGQAARGHQVGLIVDSLTGGTRADAVLAELAPRLAFGVERVAIPRQLGVGDIGALRFVAGRIAAFAPHVVHGHGAKGAALARLAARGGNGAIRVYTPHGGSLVYAPATISGGFYRTLEQLLNWRTDLFLFESDYIAQEFRRKIGAARGMVRIVRNGVGDADFTTIATRADATDLVCVGELRTVKAIDILLEALAALKQSGRRLTATIAGDGPQRTEFMALAQRLGVDDQVQFVGHQPAREAFAMGKILVVCSRAESLPYIVLEAAAAAMPIIATRVGGIGEIFGPDASRLIPADDAAALAQAVAAALDDPAQSRRLAQALNVRVQREFTVDAMVEGGLAAYREALARRKVAQFP
jgi:glycosyltransferase involved in cell wall biosynthesis